MRRASIVTAVVVAALFLMATPAGADPARPTNYRSRIASVTPRSSAVALKIVGGDGFLDLTVARGHTVVVRGYRDASDLYLRVQRDGTVQENTNSPATYLNRNRYGTATIPPALLGDTLPAPVWRTIGHQGHAVWHDHRIHFMGKDPSAIDGLAEGRPVPWTVDLTVDGTPTVARGSYRLLGAPSPLPYLLLLAAVAAAVVLVARRRPVPVAAAAVLLGGLIGVVIGIEQNAAIPAAAGGTPITVALPAIGVLAGLLALARRAAPAGVIAVLAGVASEGGWFITRSSVLWKAVLPTELAPGLDRAGTAVVVGLAAGAAIAAIQSGALAQPARTAAGKGAAAVAPTGPAPG